MKAEDKAEKLAEFIGEEPRVQCKICGISRERDIDFLNDALPDYAGFIFARSPRKVTPDKAAGLISLLDPRIKAVGVFVNETAETIADIAKKTHLFVIQLHGDEDFETIREVKERTGLPVWKPSGQEARKTFFHGTIRRPMPFSLMRKSWGREAAQESASIQISPER